MKHILDGIPEETLSVEQEESLFTAGDAVTLISHNLREAFYYAKGCSQKGELTEGEILSAVYMGLTSAAKNFQIGRIRFLAYAKPYVRGALSRATTANCLVKTVRKTEALPVEEPEDEESSYVPPRRMVDCPQPDMEGIYLKEEWLQLRSLLFQVLDDKERAIIELSYIGGLNLREIADLLGVSRADIHHCRMEALTKIRAKINEKCG